MRDFILAPFLSLFSLKFYRRLLALPQTLGFLYLAYLSLFLSVWALFMFRLYTFPVADDLMSWLAKNLPAMVFTQKGIQMEIKEPLLLSHPRWGPFIYLDPTSDAPKTDDLEKAFVVITRTKVSYRNPSTGENRTLSILPKNPQQERRDVKITGDAILKFWKRSKPFVASIFFVTAFLILYLWKLLAGVFYSLIALIFNYFRSERLRYPSLLNLTFFALTPAALLEFFSWSFAMWRIPFNLLTAILVTSLYLVLAILLTQDQRPTTE